MNRLKRLREGGFLIAQVHQLSGRVFGRILKAHGLGEITPARGRILFALWQRDSVPIQDLSRRTSLSKSTLTAMLDTLESEGHISRFPSSEDRREVLIRLTEKDAALRDAYLGVSAEMEKVAYRNFTRSEIDAFEKALRRILANLADAEKEILRTAAAAGGEDMSWNTR
jgi:DNA-binding MarR family transcriptional regulator